LSGLVTDRSIIET